MPTNQRLRHEAIHWMTGSQPNDENLSAIPAPNSSLCLIVLSGRRRDYSAVARGPRKIMVQPDIFGNLSRKSEILAKLEELASRDQLDDHQIGLARILRLRHNQNLINAALEYAAKIGRASDILIAEALNVLVAQELPISTRALAALVLGHLIRHRHTETVSQFDLDTVIESMNHVLSRSESPLLKKALWSVLARNRKPRNDGSISPRAPVPFET
jgi:hypothetical protein